MMVQGIRTAAFIFPKLYLSLAWSQSQAQLKKLRKRKEKKSSLQAMLHESREVSLPQDLGKLRWRIWVNKKEFNLGVKAKEQTRLALSHVDSNQSASFACCSDHISHTSISACPTRVMPN
jgi:hypothetical protein